MRATVYHPTLREAFKQDSAALRKAINHITRLEIMIDRCLLELNQYRFEDKRHPYSKEDLMRMESTR